MRCETWFEHDQSVLEEQKRTRTTDLDGAREIWKMLVHPIPHPSIMRTHTSTRIVYEALIRSNKIRRQEGEIMDQSNRYLEVTFDAKRSILIRFLRDWLWFERKFQNSKFGHLSCEMTILPIPTAMFYNHVKE